MIKRPIVNFAFIFILLLLSNCTQRVKNKAPRSPKLVVGIVVDQMRYDYLLRYYKKYENSGFKRLMKEGFSCNDAEYNYVPTYTAPGHTSIYTGTTPSMHGMVANEWYDRQLGRMVYCTEDTTVKTVGSISKAGMMSPKRELTTTIGDELKLSDNGQSKVIGISLKDRAAILPAGHMANAAYWLDDATGRWITSSYYMNELPGWVKKFNDEGRVQKYLSQPWTTLLPLNEYTESMKDDNPYEGIFKGEEHPVFPHNLPALMKQNGGYGLIKTTPFGDDLTTDFAIETIKNEQLGKGNFTDMLTVSFSSPDFIGHMYGTAAIETEDTYLRLDKDISRLLSFLDDYLGKRNVLVFLTADHGAALNPQYLEDNHVPAGYINNKQIALNIGEHMVKKYGDSLLLAVVNQQCYLDKNKILEKGLNLETIEQEAASLASNCSGVERAIPAYMLSSSAKDFISQKIYNGYYQNRSGDVIINFLPEYIICAKTGTTHGSPYIYDTHVPLIFYGTWISPGSTDDVKPITDIAPTVAYLLGISYPDGCAGHSIKLLNP